MRRDDDGGMMTSSNVRPSNPWDVMSNVPLENMSSYSWRNSTIWCLCWSVMSDGSLSNVGPIISENDCLSSTVGVDSVAAALLAVLNVMVLPSTASVPITTLLYNNPLLCGHKWVNCGATLDISTNLTITGVATWWMLTKCSKARRPWRTF